MTGGESPKVIGVVSRDDAPAEADGGRHDERIDRQCAVRTDVAEQVPSDSRHPRSGRHDLRKPASQNDVDRFVGSVASVQLDQHRGRDSDRGVTRMSTTHRRPHPAMASRIDTWPGERRHGLAVED